MNSSVALLPAELHVAFAKAPTTVKQKFRQWCDAAAEISAATDRVVLRRTTERWAGILGVSIKTVRNRISEWRSKGPKVFLDTLHSKQLWDTEENKLPGEFIEYFKKLCGDNKRKSAPAIRKLMRQLRQWRLGDSSQAIPGYDAPPPGDPPKGWSARNLQRYFPSRQELALERRGQSFMVGDCGPQIFTTRVGLHYMSHVMLDDVWHDNFVAFGAHGRAQLCRVLELDGLDVFSGALVFWGCKPRLRRADGTMDTELERYVPLCVAGLMAREGFSPRGTKFLLEHGTARMKDDVKRILSDYSHGLITFKESGITGEEQAIIGWRGQGKGNSRFKAALESHHSLKHNELGALPAQTGPDRDRRPEFTHGILDDDDDLLKAMMAVAKKHPTLAAQLRTRTLDYHSAFLPALMEIYWEINERTWHKLEGWDKIPGNVQLDYRLASDSDKWIGPPDFSAMDIGLQDALLAAAEKDCRLSRRRRVSPADVQRRERAGLIKMPECAVAELLWLALTPKEANLKGEYFLLSDEEIDTEPMRFESVIRTPSGLREKLADDKYAALINPFDPTRLYVFDSGNRFLGTGERVKRLNRFDEDSLRRAQGYQKKRLNELAAPLIQRHAADIRAETARLKHNANILASTPEAEWDRQLAKADPVKDQLRRAEQLASQPKSDEPFDS